MKKWRIWIQALRSLVISEWGTTIHTAINLLFAWTFLSWACMHTNYIFNTNKKFKARYIIHKICTFYKRKKIKEVFNSINNTYLNNVPIYKENIHFVWFVNNLSSWNTNFLINSLMKDLINLEKGSPSSTLQHFSQARYSRLNGRPLSLSTNSMQFSAANENDAIHIFSHLTFRYLCSSLI